MDWNTPIDPEDQQILDPGQYWAKVTKLEQGYTKDGKDLQATVTLAVFGEGGNPVVFTREYLTLRPNLYWKIGEAFCSLGLREHGQKNWIPPWNQAAGRTCRVEVEVEQFNGRDRVKVKRWLDPVDGAPPAYIDSIKAAASDPVPAPPQAAETEEPELPF